MAVSSSLSEALLANRIAYCGQVVLPLAMLMIIFRITNTKVKAWVPYCLLGLGAIILFIAASPGYLNIYYAAVDFKVVDGVATLIKTYGPLHPIYMFYLIGYFIAMVVITVYAWMKKSVDSPSHAVIIVIAVFVNIGVWYIEQLVSIQFEMLSISYIISELFLLGVHLVMNEQYRLRELLKQKESSQVIDLSTPNEVQAPADTAADIQDSNDIFIRGFDKLTARELELFRAYITGDTTKEIMKTMDISENTLKYHSKNLYGKLGVTSRKQMVAVYRRLRSAGITIGE